LPESKYIVYGLVDPRTDEIRYVGKSSSGLERPRWHGYPSALTKGRTHKQNWIRELVSEGLVYRIKVLEVVAAKEELADAEIKWIKYGHDEEWPLTNITAGGEGPGMTRAHYANLSRLFKGKAVSPERRQRMLAVASKRQGVARSVAVKEKLREAAVRQFSSPEGRLAVSRARGGAPVSASNGTTYASASEAARSLGIQVSNVVAVLRGRRKATGGLTFRYIHA
jgi:hypothetical protein